MNAKERFDLIRLSMYHRPQINAAVFNTLRILKRANKGDTYYENYLWHFQKRGDTFVDYYHLLWDIGAIIKPKRIMEIGCRTGISICQLLSAMTDYEGVTVDLFDVFNDGFISPDLVKMNLKYLNIPTDMITFHVGSSLDTVPAFADYVEFDYILVDGCHDPEVARQDLENVVPLLAPSGIIIFDDIAPDGCNLINVWEDFKNKHGQGFMFAENYDGKGVGIAVKKELE